MYKNKLNKCYSPIKGKEFSDQDSKFRPSALVPGCFSVFTASYSKHFNKYFSIINK
jgi:hypothetical protein